MAIIFMHLVRQPTGIRAKWQTLMDGPVPLLFQRVQRYFRTRDKLEGVKLDVAEFGKMLAGFFFAGAAGDYANQKFPGIKRLAASFNGEQGLGHIFFAITHYFCMPPLVYHV